MPTERRDVLFNLGEMTALLSSVADKCPAFIPGNLSTSKITEIMHTRDSAKSFHDQKTRMLALLKEAPKGEGVVFRATRPGAVMGERAFGFFVPENVMLDVLLAECRSLKIMIPKRASKLVIAEDLAISLRVILDDNALQLEQ